MQGCVISCGTVVFFQKSRNLSRSLLTNNNFYCPSHTLTFCIRKTQFVSPTDFRLLKGYHHFSPPLPPKCVVAIFENLVKVTPHIYFSHSFVKVTRKVRSSRIFLLYSTKITGKLKRLLFDWVIFMSEVLEKFFCPFSNKDFQIVKKRSKSYSFLLSFHVCKKRRLKIFRERKLLIIEYQCQICLGT